MRYGHWVGWGSILLGAGLWLGACGEPAGEEAAPPGADDGPDVGEVASRGGVSDATGGVNNEGTDVGHPPSEENNLPEVVKASAGVEVARDAGLVPGWMRYRHPVSGVSFQHPAAWTVRVEAAGIVIVPDDFDASRELLFGYGAPVQAEMGATAPEVVQALDGFVRQNTPGLRRGGAPTAMEHGVGAAARYTYAGVLPDGRRAVSDVYVLVADGLAVSITHLADEQRRAERAATLEQVFATLTTKPPPEDRVAGRASEEVVDVGDRRLIGMFQGEAIAAGVEDVYINTQIVYAFGADGLVLNGARSHMSAQKRDHNQDLVWTAHGHTGGSVTRGRWEARDGFLIVQWDKGGRSVFAYGFEPDGSLVLRHPQTRKLINFFPRLR